jgi:hypothetical protein
VEGSSGGIEWRDRVEGSCGGIEWKGAEREYYHLSCLFPLIQWLKNKALARVLYYVFMCILHCLSILSILRILCMMCTRCFRRE